MASMHWERIAESVPSESLTTSRLTTREPPPSINFTSGSRLAARCFLSLFSGLAQLRRLLKIASPDSRRNQIIKPQARLRGIMIAKHEPTDHHQVMIMESGLL
jgi:hypothetical protein